ncbi:MAG TPA: MFS transporter [Gemmataceae bacterium]|nr:MFS transporter [Gemmataceae bacterium]
MGTPNLPIPPTRVRLGVLGFLCSLSLLTYLDRVCIMRVRGNIETDLNIDPVQMGLVFAAFAVGYGVFEVPGGWMGDVWGPRRVLTRIVLWWSLFTALTGLIFPSTQWPWFALAAMLTVRFLFGCGEAGAYPNVARVVGSWFPYRERGLAQGAVWMSARLGGAIAPVVIGGLSYFLGGWRQAFWALGIFGAVWCVLFYFWFRDRPEDKPTCNQGERDLIRQGPYSWKAEQAGVAHPKAPWGQLLRSPSLWFLCLASFGVSFAWYFFPTWQPRYLEDYHRLTPSQSQWLTGLPFLCGACGALIGGFLSDWLIRITGSRRWGRSLVGLFGFSGAGACLFCVALLDLSAGQAVTLLCLAFFINDLAIPPIWAATTDIGGRYAGTVAGIMNMAGCVGAALSPALTPILLEEPLLAGGGCAAGAHALVFGETVPIVTRWGFVFGVFATAWIVAALAWLGINASKPIVHEPAPPTTTTPETGIREAQ